MKEFRRIVKYVLENPIKAGSWKIGDWKWSYRRKSVPQTPSSPAQESIRGANGAGAVNYGGTRAKQSAVQRAETLMTDNRSSQR
jgi:hypothetical protein